MKLVFFTGAGISQESGISTYRDEDGIWSKYDPQEVCSIDGWNKNHKKVIDFFKEVTEGMDKCSPNEAHHLIAGLEKEHEVVVITQNIDNLHEKAGSTNVIHIHGELYKDKVTPRGTRPDVVLFGENPKRWYEACDIVYDADVFVIIGTSLEVYPAASIIEYTNTNHKFYIDPRPKEFSAYTLIPMNACEGMKSFISMMNL